MIINDRTQRHSWSSKHHSKTQIITNTVITKTCLYNFDPLKPQLYSKTGVCRDIYYFFLFLLKNIDCGYSLEPPRKNIDCGYSLEPPRRGGSNEYPQSMFLSRNMKHISVILSKHFQFLEVKFSIYLKRRVFVMDETKQTARNCLLKTVCPNT